MEVGKDAKADEEVMMEMMITVQNEESQKCGRK